ncbi:hypothetical protein QE152_g4655 [Popillia japonica]|uniref:Uncharacterized protein n=1 Tax=Popillia japonica TaxID=7064 RepID=A0AAW1MTI5_POPJA
MRCEISPKKALTLDPLDFHIYTTFLQKLLKNGEDGKHAKSKVKKCNKLIDIRVKFSDFPFANMCVSPSVPEDRQDKMCLRSTDLEHQVSNQSKSNTCLFQ